MAGATPSPKARAHASLRRQIEDADALTEDDRSNLLAFDDQMALLRSEYSIDRREKLLRHCAIMAGLAQRIPPEELPTVHLTDTLERKDAAEQLVRWVNSRYQNEETNRDYRIALRVFGKLLTDGKEVPPSLAWISSTTSRNYNPIPNPAEMLSWDDDIVPMLDAAANSRDAALIASAWDSGARAGEFLQLRYQDIADHRHGLQVIVDGKRGQRRITLIPAVPYMSRWLADHPSKDGPLWSSLHTTEAVTEQYVWKLLRRTGKRAGVIKPVNLTNFRKSCASFLASRGMNQAQLEDRMGWKRGSAEAARYVALFGPDVDADFARIHGVETEADESVPIGPVVCPRCQKQTPRHSDFCVWCHQALTSSALPELHHQEEEVRRAVLRMARESPDIVDDIERAERLMQVFDANPALYSDLHEYLEANNQSPSEEP